MEATERARVLGAEHGERDARAWLENEPTEFPKGPDHLEWTERKPEPDLSGDRPYTIFDLADECLGDETASLEPIRDAYCAAYREARDRVIREAVQS